MQPDNTIEMIGLALDAALMRQTAIAANIANTNTKGYQAIGVDFETQLQNVSESGLNDVKPVYEYTEEPVSIDDQMALSVKNATQYRALIKGLNHKLAIMKLALQGNNAS
jgi:flagellar basal-body rod protein FlgB